MLINFRYSTTLPDMVLTNAEKQKRYRDKIKADPTRERIDAENERLRWHERKKAGKVQTINQMTPREQRSQRKKWRQNYQNCKFRKEEEKKLRAQEENVCQHTPPTSPNAQLDDAQPAEGAEPMAPPACNSSRQKKKGRKTLRRNRTASYREIKRLEMMLKMEKKKAEKYRKQAQRTKVKIQFPKNRKASEVPSYDDSQVTPRKRARRFLQQSSPRRLQKELVFHYSLSHRLRERYARMKNDRKQGQLISKIFGSRSTLKKYKTIKKTTQEFGVSRQMLKKNEGRDMNQLVYERKLYNKAVRDGSKKKVHTFFQEDDVSRATAGKKETVTRHKTKKQKRYLLEPMNALHKKFLAIHPELPTMSLSTFQRLKPFWVVRPRIQDRETCLCKRHENTDFMHTRLRRLGYLQEQSVSAVVKKIVCDSRSKGCMYRECPECKDKVVVYQEPAERNKETVAEEQRGEDETTGPWWWQWMSVTEDFNGKNIHKTVKKKVHGSVAMLKEAYSKNIQDICTHLFNINHQFQVCKEKKENLSDDEVLVHVDFAENWICKGLRQIQSAHFGGSNAQVTLHTGIAYVRLGGATAPVSFCSISGNNAHTPQAIWSHLQPVLGMLRRKHPQLQKLHFLSDGPVTQYRGRGNLHLLANLPHTMGFKEVWWNFSEAGHGKGAADGIGAAIKQLADRVVLSGTTIDDAHTLFEKLQGRTKVELFYIPDDAITRLPDVVPAVKGIMKVHQVYSREPGKISVRAVSCYCSPTFCACYSPVEHHVLGGVPQVVQEQDIQHVVQEQDVTHVVKDPDVTQIVQEPDVTQVVQEPDVTQIVQDALGVQQISEEPAGVQQMAEYLPAIKVNDYVAVKLPSVSAKHHRWQIYFAKVRVTSPIK